MQFPLRLSRRVRTAKQTKHRIIHRAHKTHATNVFSASFFVLCKATALLLHHPGATRELAGMAGFEPTDARVKVWCLTSWRHPYIFPAALQAALSVNAERHPDHCDTGTDNLVAPRAGLRGPHGTSRLIPSRQWKERYLKRRVEPLTGIEPAYLAWEASILPLNYSGI